MHTDVGVDDELQPCQPDTVVRQLAEVESQLRIADVHHDLEVDRRHLAALDFGDLGLQQAVVDVAGITLGTADGDERAFRQQLGRVAATHHRRNPEFARDDGCMAGTPAAIGHDGAGALHHGFPIRVGHVRHEHIARLDLVHFTDVVDDAHRTGTDLLANGASLRQHRAAALELVAELGLAVLLALHGLRAGLKDVEMTVGTVLAPLDVHGATVMRFDDQRIAGKRLHVFVRQRIAVA